MSNFYCHTRPEGLLYDAERDLLAIAKFIKALNTVPVPNVTCWACKLCMTSNTTTHLITSSVCHVRIKRHPQLYAPTSCTHTSCSFFDVEPNYSLRHSAVRKHQLYGVCDVIELTNATCTAVVVQRTVGHRTHGRITKLRVLLPVKAFLLSASAKFTLTGVNPTVTRALHINIKD